jgi:protein-disulfide isomerase
MSRILIAAALLATVAGCQRTATTQAKSTDNDPAAPVAKWDGGAITGAELDAAVYDQKKQALDQMLVRRLVEQKAKAENLTAEALVKREIQDKLKKPSDDDLKKFYDEQAKRQPLPPFDQVKEQIIQYLERPQMAAAQQAFVEKLKKEMNVVVNLKPPRVEVAAEGPSRGAANAPVTIVEFSDYECPYCSRAEEVVNRVLKDYDGKVRLVYRDFPLPIHPQAQKASEAAHCAGDQGKYWEMHEKLFANQQALQPDALKGYAKDLKLDEPKFAKCLDSGEKAKEIETGKKAGEKLGVTGTPAFFINGLQLTGAQPYEEFKSLIDGELARK